jgi:hypothetical protein
VTFTIYVFVQSKSIFILFIQNIKKNDKKNHFLYYIKSSINERTNTYFWFDLAANTIHSRTERATNYTKVNRFIDENIYSILFSLLQVVIVL